MEGPEVMRLWRLQGLLVETLRRVYGGRILLAQGWLAAGRRLAEGNLVDFTPARLYFLLQVG